MRTWRYSSIGCYISSAVYALGYIAGHKTQIAHVKKARGWGVQNGISEGDKENLIAAMGNYILKHGRDVGVGGYNKIP